MHALEFALAAVFLTQPANKLDFDISPEMQTYLGPRIVILARHWEMLDVRERDCLKKPERFDSDLKMLRSRYVTLLDAPKWAEVERFPNRQLAHELMNANRRYWKSVHLRGDLTPDQLSTVLAETDRLYKIYDAVAWAQFENYYISYRRQVLAELRDLIGRRAFTAGQLPFHLPRVNLP